MLDEKLVSDLKEKHGDRLIAVECADGSHLIFRAPKRQEFDNWMDKRSDDKAKASAVSRELAQQTLVHPSRDAMMAALDIEPALLLGKNGIIDAVTELAGLTHGGAPPPKKL